MKKINKILDAWLEYIALEDYSSARVEVARQDEILNRSCLSLEGNYILIDENYFLEVQQTLQTEPPSQQDVIWGLSLNRRHSCTT